MRIVGFAKETRRVAEPHQTGVGPDDEPPVVITVPHDRSYDQPHGQQHNAEQNAANGPDETGITVYDDKNAKVTAPPAAEAGLKLLCWLCDCETLWLGILHEQQVFEPHLI